MLLSGVIGLTGIFLFVAIAYSSSNLFAIITSVGELNALFLLFILLAISGLIIAIYEAFDLKNKYNIK